jgi:hypothetical protein
MAHRTLLSDCLSTAWQDVNTRIEAGGNPSFTGNDFALTRKLLLLQVGTVLYHLHKDSGKGFASFEAFEREFDALMEKTLRRNEPGS